MKKILIVDDEEAIANVFKKQLTLVGGFEVDLAIGGEEALTMLNENKYDLILLDLMMSEIDGFEVAKSINEKRDEFGDVKFIVLTNVTNEEAVNQAKDLGATDYLVKTDIQLDDLLNKINSL